MRRQLLAIVILGLFALVSFGVMASYLTTRNPRIALQQALGKRFGVEVTGFERRGFDPSTRERVVAVQLRRPGGGAPAEESASHAIALAADKLLARGRSPDRLPYDAIELRWDGGPTERYRRSWLLFRQRMEQEAGRIERLLVEQLGPDTKVELAVDGERFGLALRLAPRATAGADAARGPTPEEAARAVLRLTRRYAFVDVAHGDERPQRFELGALRTRVSR